MKIFSATLKEETKVSYVLNPPPHAPLAVLPAGAEVSAILVGRWAVGGGVELWHINGDLDGCTVARLVVVERLTFGPLLGTVNEGGAARG